MLVLEDAEARPVIAARDEAGRFRSIQEKTLSNRLVPAIARTSPSEPLVLSGVARRSGGALGLEDGRIGAPACRSRARPRARLRSALARAADVAIASGNSCDCPVSLTNRGSFLGRPAAGTSTDSVRRIRSRCCQTGLPLIATRARTHTTRSMATAAVTARRTNIGKLRTPRDAMQASRERVTRRTVAHRITHLNSARPS